MLPAHKVHAALQERMIWPGPEHTRCNSSAELFANKQTTIQQRRQISHQLNVGIKIDTA